LLLGDSGVGKSCIILRYTENQFSQNLMNSIGVDFKLKNILFKEKNIKLQIVRINLISSGTQQDKRDLEQSQQVTTRELKQL
jgi:GTPase SAR1 family protein